jgi:hypothetical protein
MRCYYKNDIDQATLSASSADTGQSLDNLKIPQLARTYQFTGDDESIVIDFGSDKNIKSFLVDIGNLSSSGTYKIEGNATDSWTSPSYSESLVKTDTCLYKDMDETYRYYRLTLNDSSVTKIKIGYIQLSSQPYLQMPPINPNVELYYTTTSKASTSIGGQLYGDEGYRYLETKFTFSQIGEQGSYVRSTLVASRKDILNMWNEVQNITPMWVFLWSENLDEYPPLFSVIKENRLAFKKLDYGKYYSTSLTIMEVK